MKLSEQIKKNNKLNLKYKTLDIPIYHKVVYYKLGGNAADFQTALEKDLNYKFEKPFPKAYGFNSRRFVLDNGHGFYVLWSEEGREGTLAHEIFELTCKIMADVGIKFDDSSREAYSYLIGWITDEIKK